MSEIPVPDTTAEDDLLTVDEAAEWLKITTTTLYSLVNAGKLPHIRIGRSIRISRDDVRRMKQGGDR